MNSNPKALIGYTCAYTPLPVIDAAGYTPYRIFPMGDSPDRAGQLLHDNICPHVKKVLDRAIADDLPDLDGLVIINSCDAMRRLADAWEKVRPSQQTILLDLPATTDPLAVRFYAKELQRLCDALSEWTGKAVDEAAVSKSISAFNHVCLKLAELESSCRNGKLQGGRSALQDCYNFAATHSLAESRKYLAAVVTKPSGQGRNASIPVFLFGNVVPDPESYTFFEDCGARIAGDDFCTGARMFHPISRENPGNSPFEDLAAGILKRPPCARTFTTARPGGIAEDIARRAKECSAKGVIGHTVKFCDPYLARLPMIREELKAAGIPLLLLEGDCTMRTIGQQKTRIEAFLEMLG